MDKYRSVPMDTPTEIRNFPVGTMALGGNIDGYPRAAVKIDDSRWARTDVGMYVSDFEMIGWIALVRIDDVFL